MKCRSILTILLIAACAPTQADDEFFESRVRPLLAKRCFECHRRTAEGGLRLDSLRAMLQGGNSGPAIVSGDASSSLLIQVVSGQHSEISMPPEEPLRAGEIKALVTWIDSGADWPKPVAASRIAPDEHGITDQEREFWSFRPIRRPSVPKVVGAVTDGAANINPIDAFITRQHQQRQLQPSPPAHPRSLIRRLTLNLTGLPPAPDAVEAFESASRTDAEGAYKELVEDLLASRHYGERWAQHWLDLVRYADTAGDASDYPIPEAYKYRNYVIDSFNDDKPYDQFVCEQIAGDLMPGEDDESWQRVIATGYIAISRRIGVSPQNLRHIMIEDTLDNVGKTFLGLTIGCARCHDHKFDPIPTADYYALYGIFDSTVYPHPGAEHQPYRSDFIYRIGRNHANQLLASHRKRLEPYRSSERAAFERYKAFQVRPINVPGLNRDIAWKHVLQAREEIRKVAHTFPDLETAYAATESDPNDVHIHKQGEPKNRGRIVRRGFLQILGGQTLDEHVSGSGRLQLANWIADANNPLTARVMANRVWHHHFGRGLVATPSDFGSRGARPSHPDLLDFLAGYLIDNGWSIKQLHRLIVHSKTYRLSSIASAANELIDPQNVSLWRANRKRLDAEQIRDSILMASAQLDLSPGQAHPVPHYLTYYYRQHEPFVADFSTKRRTIYLFRQRIRKHKFLDLFDAPDGNLHVGARRPTITSLQSLFFMNSPFVDQQSRAIARRIIDAADTHADRARWAYLHLFGREPTVDEIQTTEQQVEQLKILQTGPSKTLLAWTGMVRAMLASNEFIYVD